MTCFLLSHISVTFFQKASTDNCCYGVTVPVFLLRAHIQVVLKQKAFSFLIDPQGLCRAEYSTSTLQSKGPKSFTEQVFSTATQYLYAHISV